MDIRLSDVTDMAKIRNLGFKNRNEFLMHYFENVLFKKIKLKASFAYILYFLSFGALFANNRNKLIDLAIGQVERDMDIKNLMDQI